MSQLTTAEITRAWKDQSFRDSLTDEQKAQLPENPVGAVELGDSELERIAGGTFARLSVVKGIKPTWRTAVAMAGPTTRASCRCTVTMGLRPGGSGPSLG